MAKDHFIPASFIARFSDSPAEPSRKSIVGVRFRGNPKIVEKRAEAIAYANSLYDVSEVLTTTGKKNAVDNVWSVYEPNIPKTLDALISRELTAHDFLETLVPFVAGFFCRDLLYEERVNHRLDRLNADIPQEINELVLRKDHLNTSRLQELDNFASRLLACNWTVYETDGNVILSDVGIAFCAETGFVGTEGISYILPISTRHIVHIVPLPIARPLKVRDREFVPAIEYSDDIWSSAELNGIFATVAQRYCVGSVETLSSISFSKEDQRLTVAQIDEAMNHWQFFPPALRMNGLHGLICALVSRQIDIDDALNSYLKSGDFVKRMDEDIQIFSVRVPSKASDYIRLIGDSLFITAHHPGVEVHHDGKIKLTPPPGN